MAQHTQ